MDANPLGLHLSFTRTTPLPERLSVLRDAGFDATALWWEHEREEIRAIRDRVPDLVRRSGLDIDHLHAPYFACNELWSDDTGSRDKALDLHCGWIDDCARHGVPRLVMHVSRGRSAPLPHAATIDAFCALVANAEDRGVTLAIENTHSTAHVDTLLSAIDSPALKMCYDVAHDRLHSGEPLALLRRWAGRVAVLHVSDTDGRRDWHWLPGDGDTDFGAVAACLGTYSGTVMLEGMMRRTDADTAAFALRAREAAASVRELLAPGRSEHAIRR